MRKIFVCIGFLFLSCNLLAQVEIDEQIGALKDSMNVLIERYDGEPPQLDVLYVYSKLLSALHKRAMKGRTYLLVKESDKINSELYEFIDKNKLKKFIEKHPSMSTFYNISGVSDIYTEVYSKSFEYYQKALTIKVDSLSDSNISSIEFYNNVGLACFYRGNYARSLESFQKALKVSLKINGERDISTIRLLNNVGSLNLKTGNYSKALECFQKTLSIIIPIVREKHTSTATIFNNIGRVYLKKDEYSKASEYFQKALAIELEILGEKHTSTARSLNNIGLVYKGEGNYSKALEYFQKALVTKLEILGEKNHSTAKSFYNVGLIYVKEGEYSKASKYFQKALVILSEILGKKHPDLIIPQVGLANVFEALTNFNKADSLWNIIIPNMEEQLNKNYLFLPEDKKILYLKTIEYTFIWFYNFSVHNGSEQARQLAANLLINTKSQILDYTTSTRYLIDIIKDENLDSINFKLDSINQKVSKAELLSKNELEQKGWSLDTLRLLQDELATQILEHPELESKLCLPKFSWEQIKEKLKNDEALIDYFTFYDRVDSAWVYQAMLIKKDISKPIFIPISPTEPVIDLLQIKDNFPHYIQYKETRQEMYGYIWQALEPHLQDIKTIHLTPVASLNKVVFESLQNEEGKYLAGLYDFHYYSSSKDFYKQTESQPDYANATLYGHIAYFEDHQAQYELDEDTFALRLQRDTLQPLPATLHEVNAIESICTKSNIHPTLLTIDAAKEDTIAYFSGDRAPDIIHFATHGAYLPPLNKTADKMEMASLTGQDRFRAADNPLQRSMLMLSNAGETWQKSGPNIIADNDGILTALEVTNLDLSNTELVVLSACNSGIGSQHTTEGVFGLPRAFKLAGVDKILVSLWPVEDETTKELMILFYTNLLQHKQEAALALRNAKAEMRKKDDRPKKWAGFVLVE